MDRPSPMAPPSPPTPTATGSRPALRTLERMLRARRLAQLDLRFRLVLLILAALVSAFAYWQVRVPLDGAVRAGGLPAGATHLAAVLTACLALAAALAFERQAAQLREPPGPDWLALPIEPTHVLAHLRSESRQVAALALVPAAAALVAALGLLPLWVLLLAAAVCLLGWLEATRAACALAHLLVVSANGPERALPRAMRALVSRATTPAHRARAGARWRRQSAASAITSLDLLATSRRGPSRTRAAIALLLAVLVLLAWGAAAPPAVRRALSFAAFLPACAALGAWSIARACDLPASLHRPLPIAPRDAWLARARVLVAAVVALALLAMMTAALRGEPGLGAVALLWPIPGLAAALLGLHHGLTMPAHAATAEGLYLGWLSVMLIASWMIPLLGWVVLLAALLHSLRRLPRETHPEAV